MNKSALLVEMAENLDQRRLEFTNMRRVILKFAGGPLESAVVRMAIPMVYALWEGYVKEVCQLYLEYIEHNVSRAVDLHPAILGHMWTPELRPLTGGLNFSRKKSVAALALAAGISPVAFRATEKEVNTKWNLNYKVLEDIADHLCLDISALVGWRNRLNALVHLRNNIAHGARPTELTYSDFDDYAHIALSLMEAFEDVLSSGATNRAFCTMSSYPRARPFESQD
jgi:RiboL-PSP-HEPN